MTICIIPARSKSKRIKNKNIRLFAGKPLIYYSIKAAKESGIFSKIVVSTDSKKIAKIAVKYGAEVPFIRSKKLSNNYAKTYDVLVNCIKKIKSFNVKYHFCILPTAPLILKDDLKKAFKKIKHINFDSLIAVTDYDYSPLRALKFLSKNKITFNNKKHMFTRSQDLKKLCHDSGSFYIFKTIPYLKSKGVIMKKTTFYPLNKLSAVDIDTIDQFKFAEFLFRYKKRNLK